MTAPTPGPERDLSNAQFVGRNGYGIISVGMPLLHMTRDEALVHAAWLVILAGGELEIGEVIAAIGGARPSQPALADPFLQAHPEAEL